jgi:hypothetical protein
VKKVKIVFGLVLAVLAFEVVTRSGLVLGQEKVSSRLVVVWTSGDPDVAHQVCFMYTGNARKQKWFDEVTLIVWGPSARLLAGDKSLQAKIKGMLDDGVRVQACLACADSYGVRNSCAKWGSTLSIWASLLQI